MTDKEAVSYANIGVVGKGLGTVSDQNGSFTLDLSAANNQDTVAISAIGYESIVMKVEAFKEQCSTDCTLAMNPTNYNLETVSIESKGLKRKIVGVIDAKDNISIGFTTDALGHEIGAYMKIKRPAYLSEVNIKVNGCEGDSIFFRLNVYDKKKGMPNQNILKRPIYLSYACSDILNGIRVDVVDEGIYVEDDFFIALENINPTNEALSFSLKGKFFSKGTYYRSTSQDNWNKIGIVASGISAVVLEEKK